MISNRVKLKAKEIELVGNKSKTRVLIEEIYRNKISYFLIAPFLILFILLTVIPVISAIALSFSYYNIIDTPHFTGWSNFQQLFLEDDVFLIAVKNTFIFAIVTGPISYFACLLIAWLVNDLPPKLRAFATLLFYAPSLSGGGLLIWTMIFSGDAYGLLNGFLIKFGFIQDPIPWLSDPNRNFAIIMMVSLWMSLGTSFLSFIAGLQGIDKSLNEAGAIDGIKNRWQELWYITLPSMKPQLLFGAVMQVASSFAVGDICASLAGNPSPLYSAHTIVLHMQDYGGVRYEMGYSSAIAVVLFITTTVITVVIRRLLGDKKD